MPRLIWSPEALADIRRHWRFLADRDLEAAKAAVAAIRAGMRMVERHPGMGRPMEDMPPEFREWPIDYGESGYVAFYHFDGETALVLRIRHQREAGWR